MSKIHEYYEYKFSKGEDEGSANLFRGLSTAWQIKLQLAVKSKFISAASIFKDMPKGATEAMVLKMNPRITMPAELIITQGVTFHQTYY
jgi:hypothetical protein